MPFSNITPEETAAFSRSLSSGQYSLLLGSGISTDSTNSRGSLPTGEQLRQILCDLKGVQRNAPLQQVFSLLTEDEIEDQITSRYINCSPGPSVLHFPHFLWKRAFTFNIDDVLEAAYAIETPGQTLLTRHFNDPYEDSGPLTELLLVHLHGFVLQPERGYIFSRNEYINQINGNNPWMVILSQIFAGEPIIIIGSSLDELDLDYYLSFRTKTSGRTEDGPSIYVSPTTDALTDRLCELNCLHHFVGTCQEFFEYCENIVPKRPTPYELIPTERQNIFPAHISNSSVLAFWSDFELVPGTAEPEDAPSRFMYGHPPTWSDLSNNLDISRTISAQIIADIEQRLENPADTCRLMVLFELPGAGKTTILNRCAFELAQRGVRTLRCTALSRLEPIATSNLLDQIDKPIVIFADNFADQVTSFTAILDTVKRKDIVIIGAERSYRRKYVQQTTAGADLQIYSRADFRQHEANQLIQKYMSFGLLGTRRAFTEMPQFSKELTKDPIAVACCRILNDFRPLDSIIDSMIADCKQVDKIRYLVAALGRHCYSGGIRYSILSATTSTTGLRQQLRRDHPLPLAYYQDGKNSFVEPQNASVANRLLNLVSERDRNQVLEVFVALANGIAPHVNRHTIRRRTPEARLAGRLFDLDGVVENFLAEDAQVFYADTQEAWKWNSRYWEQVALLSLAKYRKEPNTLRGREALEQAVQHARHAVTIETHPIPLTTLGQTLIARMGVEGFSLNSTYAEAFENLVRAIELERSWARKAVQPFATLFGGSRTYLESGGDLSGSQLATLRALLEEARKIFPRDPEINDLTDNLYYQLKYRNYL